MWQGRWSIFEIIRFPVGIFIQNNVGATLPTVSIVNDPNLPPDCMGQLLKKDTQYGTFGKEVIEMDNCIMVDGLFDY